MMLSPGVAIVDDPIELEGSSFHDWSDDGPENDSAEDRPVDLAEGCTGD